MFLPEKRISRVLPNPRQTQGYHWVHKSVILCGFFLLFCSCSSLQNTIYLVSIDENNGEYFIENEPYVKGFLENIIEKYNEYTINTFGRTALSFQFRRTKLLTHSFFVINNNDVENFYTLSFYGTQISRHSKGAWVLNADADMTSYTQYLNGNNKWDVQRIYDNDTIDVRNTVRNIINHINSSITFYYINHIRSRNNMDNCNTALHGTIVTLDY